MTARYVDCARTHLAIKKESRPGTSREREKRKKILRDNIK